MNSIKSANDLNAFLSISHYYPPFFHVSAVPIIFFSGFSEDKIIFINFIYLILLIISLFGIGKLLFNERVGLLAALLMLFYPFMYRLSREYLIDFALVTMVTAVQYLILKSKGGLKMPWNILLGVVIGFTLLTKPVSVIFFAPVWIFVFLWNFKGIKDFFLLGGTLMISLLIAGPWYLSAFHDLLDAHKYWQNFAQINEHDPSTLIPSFLCYGKDLKNYLISPILLLFFFIGFFLFLVFDRRWKNLSILILWAIPAWIILILTPNKDTRFIMPILPVFALLTIGGIDIIQKKLIKNILYGAIITIGCIQFNILSFSTFFFSVKNKLFCEYARVPLRRDWKHKKILECISQYIGDRPIMIGVLPDCEYFNPSEFALYSYLLRLPYTIDGFGQSLVRLEQIKQYDIIILKYPEISVDYVAFYREKFYKEVNEFGIDRLGFKKIAEFELPDNSKATIWQKDVKEK